MQQPSIVRAGLVREKRTAYVEYYITSPEYTRNIDGLPGHFGVSAALYEDGRLSDSASVSHVFPSTDEMTSLIRMLAENGVTPVALKDVIEDLVSARDML